MSVNVDDCHSHSNNDAWLKSIDDLQKEMKALRVEQLQAKEQLLSGLQLIIEIVQMCPQMQVPSTKEDIDSKLQLAVPSNPTEDQRHTAMRSKSMGALPKSLQTAKGSAPEKVSGHGWVSEWKPNSDIGPGSPVIPSLDDLQRTLLRQAPSMESNLACAASTFKSASDSENEQPQLPVRPPQKDPESENELHSVVVRPQPQAEQPDAPKPLPPFLALPEVKSSGSGPEMGRRGSTLQNLTRNSQAHILSGTCDDELVCQIFMKQIGVKMWLNWSTFTSIMILLLDLCYLVLEVFLYTSGLDEGNGVWTSLSLVLFSTVALLLLQLLKRSLRSPDLNMAIQKLDEFVQDCGHGMDWGSAAKLHWLRFVVLWLVILLTFITQQMVEVQIAHAKRFDQSSHMQLIHLRAASTVFLFGVSSAVVMNGAYCQFNLLLGLGKTLDCWCADVMGSQDFISGIKTWNSMQALLKCVGREVTPCFAALNLIGYAGIIAAGAGCFSLLLDDDLQGWKVALYESALLPLVYLFYLSARVFAQGASLSERCGQIPAFVNQLGGQTADADRQYLVHFISDSAAGFIVHGVKLSQSVFLKQMHLLAAIFSGFAGVIIRRYL